MKSENDKKKKNNGVFDLFWIEIEKRTDILAAAAFLISVLGIFGQIILFFRGPNIELFVPEQIQFIRQEYPSGKFFTCISAKMIYRNAGSPGYHDAVKKEYVTFVIADQKYKLLWDDFIYSHPDEKNKKQLIINRISEAMPKNVLAGKVEYHETSFAPWVLRGHKDFKSFLEWNEFKTLISKQEKIEFSFTFETFNGKVDTVKCYLRVREFIDHLDKGWSAPVTYQ